MSRKRAAFGSPGSKGSEGAEGSEGVVGGCAASINKTGVVC